MNNEQPEVGNTMPTIVELDKHRSGIISSILMNHVICCAIGNARYNGHADNSSIYLYFR